MPWPLYSAPMTTLFFFSTSQKNIERFVCRQCLHFLAYEALGPGFLPHHSTETALSSHAIPVILLASSRSFIHRVAFSFLAKLSFLASGGHVMFSRISPFFIGPFLISLACLLLLFDLQMLEHPATWRWVLFPSISLLPCDLMKFHIDLYMNCTCCSRLCHLRGLRAIGFSSWSQNSREREKGTALVVTRDPALQKLPPDTCLCGGERWIHISLQGFWSQLKGESSSYGSSLL